MGQCYGKVIVIAGDASPRREHCCSNRLRTPPPPSPKEPAQCAKQSPAVCTWPSPYDQSAATLLPAGVSPSPAKTATPGSFFRRPFMSPSPAKHIRPALRKRERGKPPKQAAIPENAADLDRSFGYASNFAAVYVLGKELGRGHFGNTYLARTRKEELDGQHVAVKVIPKAKMTTSIAIEDVRREVKILKALSGHPNLVRFYDAYEDAMNVYIVMELCEGGELLDRILARGGKYAEEDAKSIVRQVLSVVSYCHLQGVVHRDLKPENFLFTTKEETADMKLIDFGLSDFVKLDERLNDIVGSAYYVAPEVLHRSYSIEADVWSIGVITYILLCGSRPFWSRTESGIFRSVIQADLNLDDSPWPSISMEARDFVKRLLNKDYRKRLTAAQALTHPWLREKQYPPPLDILIFKLVKSYLLSTPLRRAALKALSKTLTENELVYLRAQFELLEPNTDGCLRLDNFQKALVRAKSEAMEESRISDILKPLNPLANRSMDFEEFCTATISPHQLETLEGWGRMVATAFQHFEQEGNRAITAKELAKEMNLPPVSHSVIQSWIRHEDCKLSFLGYTKFLHGVTLRRTSDSRHH